MSDRVTVNYTDSTSSDDARDREKWRVDLATNTATHDTGLILHFKPDETTPGAWDGLPTNFEDWQKRQGLTVTDLARSLPRLMRLAGDAFTLARQEPKA